MEQGFFKNNYNKKHIFSNYGKENKALSLAEGLGRLYFCGFEVLNLKIINSNMFFISRKIKEPI